MAETDYKKERLGQKKIMNCGLMAEVTRYGSTKDVSVTFENGAIVEHTTWQRFRLGDIACRLPDGTLLKKKPGRSPNAMVTRIGEKRMMACGKECTVTAYRNAHDIDVEFADGAVVAGCEYRHFAKGAVAYPGQNTALSVKRAEREGREVTDKDGNEAVICRYDGSSNCYVRYRDGTEAGPYGYVQLMSHDFRKERIPEKLKAERTGQGGLSAEGEKIMIAEYRSATDMDVVFVSDNTVRKHVGYYDFKNGLIKKPSDRNTLHVGEVYVNQKGEHVRIVRWRGCRDVDILIEETGEERNVKSFDSIRKGKVVSAASSLSKKKNVLGQKRKNSQGLGMEIVRYRNSGDLDVRFEDGTVAPKRSYRDFAKGQILHPEVRHGTFCGYAVKKAFEEDGRVWYICTGKDGEKDILTLQELMAAQGLVPEGNAKEK